MLERGRAASAHTSRRAKNGQLEYSHLRSEPPLEGTEGLGPQPTDQRFVRERELFREHALHRGGVSCPVAVPPRLECEGEHHEWPLREVLHAFAQQVCLADGRDRAELRTQLSDLRVFEAMRVE